MSQRAAQLWLTVLFVAAAVVFTVLDHDQVAAAFVGACLGQGAAKTVDKAVNGNGK